MVTPSPPPILNLTITGQLVEQEKCSSWGNACLGHKIRGPVEIRLEKREKYLLRSRREIRGEKVGKKYLVRHQSFSSCKVFFSQPWPHCRSCEQTRNRRENQLYLKKGQHVDSIFIDVGLDKEHVESKMAQVFIRPLIHYVSWRGKKGNVQRQLFRHLWGGKSRTPWRRCSRNRGM